jgi:hypothetical protein
MPFEEIGIRHVRTASIRSRKFSGMFASFVYIVFFFELVSYIDIKLELYTPVFFTILLDFVTWFSERSLVGFGGLDDNPIKELTCVLSVEQLHSVKLIEFNTSVQV